MTTTIVNTHEAKSRLSELIRRVEAGEEVIVARAGKHVVRLVAVEATQRRRSAGSLKGLIHIEPGAFDPDPELIALFEGSDDSAPW